jgi:hypothetical protein
LVSASSLAIASPMSRSFSLYSSELVSTLLLITDMAPAWCGVLKVATVRLVEGPELERSGLRPLRGRCDRARRHWRPNWRDKSSISLDGAESDILDVQLARGSNHNNIQNNKTRLKKCNRKQESQGNG